MTILDEILDRKRRDLEAARASLAPKALAARADAVPHVPRGLRAALRDGPRPRVIAELKRRSPSKGLIRPDFDPVACAKDYAEAGAAAISVLTDVPFFGGSLEDLRAVRAAVALPLLRKDFLVDPYLIDEARVAGADAVLLIVAALAPDLLADLRARATARGLDVLVEVQPDAD